MALPLPLIACASASPAPVSGYLQGIDSAEIVDTVHSGRPGPPHTAPMTAPPLLVVVHCDRETGAATLSLLPERICS
jgi:hypothetical protein